MPSSRSIVRLALTLAGCLLAAFSGCGGSATPETAGNEGPRFAFVTNGVASFWDIAEAGAVSAGEELGCRITVIKPDGLTDQTRKLEDLLMRGTDGVAVSPINPENQIDIFNKISDECLLITQDSDAPESKRLAYIGMDNYVAGIECGKMAREALPDGGGVMLFIGRLDQDNAQFRRQGVIDGLLGREPDSTRRDPPGAVVKSDDGKYTVLGTLTDRFDRAQAKANVEDTLTRSPDVAAMVGLFVYNPPAILEALGQAGKLGEVKVIGFDEDDATLQAIEDGTAVGTVVQDPFTYGYESIRVLNGLFKEDPEAMPEGGVIDVPARRIDATNVVEFRAELKQILGKR